MSRLVGLSHKWSLRRVLFMRPHDLERSRDFVRSRDSPSHVRRADLVAINVTEMGKTDS